MDIGQKEQKIPDSASILTKIKEIWQNGIQNGLNFFQILKQIVQNVVSMVLNNDIIYIFRPAIYIFLVMKHGKKSWVPIYLTLAIDTFIAFLTFLKLIGAQKLKTIERNDIRRKYLLSLLKYFLRDPIFDTFTVRLIKRIFKLFKIPVALYEIIYNILSWWRYYSYIA